MRGEDVEMGMYDYVRVQMKLPDVAYGKNIPKELNINENCLFQTQSMEKALNHYTIDPNGMLWSMEWNRVFWSGIMKFYTFDRWNHGVSEATVLGHWYEFKAELKKGVVQSCELIKREALSRERI